MSNLIENNHLNKINDHLNKINNINFCSICYDFKNHNINNCPYKCIKCNGYHKTNEHRCLICNVRNPSHNISNCPYNKYNQHM